MGKESTIRRITVATGLALSLVFSVTVGSGKALATTGYLTAPTGLSSTSYAGASSFIVNNTTTMYYTSNSSYGNTIPSAQQVANFLNIPVSDVVSLTDNTTPFYALSGTVVTSNGSQPWTLNLTLLNQLNSGSTPIALTTTNSGKSTEVSGSYISNVFQVGAGSTLPGAVQGDLIFTYQFYENSVANSNGGITGATIGGFNDPTGSTVYTLGSGSTDTSSISGTTISCTSCTELGSSSASNGTLDPADNLSGVQGNVNFSSGGSILTLGLSNNTSGLNGGVYTPEIMVASTATNYTTGTMSFLGYGAGEVTVYVPTTPEPGTLVLFGTALGLSGFLIARKRRMIA